MAKNVSLLLPLDGDPKSQHKAGSCPRAVVRWGEGTRKPGSQHIQLALVLSILDIAASLFLKLMDTFLPQGPLHLQFPLLECSMPAGFCGFHSHSTQASIQTLASQNNIFWDCLGGPVAKTPRSQCSGAGLQSLVRELDPTCHN